MTSCSGVMGERNLLPRLARSRVDAAAPAAASVLGYATALYNLLVALEELAVGHTEWSQEQVAVMEAARLT